MGLAFFCSCASMYIPQTPNIPLHKEKGEVNLNIGANTNSLIFSGSYSFSDKYALMGAANVSYGNIWEQYPDLGALLSPGAEMIIPFGGIFAHYNLNMGLGKYKTFSKRGILEFYAGGEYGNAFAGAYKDHINNYGSIYFQSNIGKRSTTHLEAGGMIKISGTYMHYQYPEGANMTRTDEFPVLSVQMGGVLKKGGEKLKFWFSPSVNFSHAFVKVNYEDMELDLNFGKFYTFLNFSIGLTYRF